MGTDPLMSATEPDRYWTSSNTGEVIQGVATAADWTFLSAGVEYGGRHGYRDLGVFSRRVEMPTGTDDSIMGVFYGRVALNVDYVANFVDRMPGGSGDDFERDITGVVRSGIARPGTNWKRVPIMAVRIPVAVRKSAGLIEAHNEALHRWWRSTTQAGRPANPRALLGEALARYKQAMHHHARSRFLQLALFTQATEALKKIGRPEAAHTLTGAVRTEETRVMEDLWAVAPDRLPIAVFLERHGYHGPNEGALSSAVWREDLRPLELTLAALRDLDEDQSPARRHQRAVRARERLEREILATLPRLKRGPLALVLRLARTAVANMEATKAGTLMATDAGRHAIKTLGEDLVRQGTLTAPGDVFHFTMDELLGALPVDAPGVVAERRTVREEYLGYELPVFWAGVPTPVRLDEAPVAAAADGDGDGGARASSLIQGIGVSSGTFEGRACVVHDPAVDAMEVGDVLVGKVTDPSWMVVLSLAGAVVLDIGGPSSHGAIVAREFGVPCVVATRDGTRRIRSGDTIRVRGDDGVVEVLSRKSAG